MSLSRALRWHWVGFLFINGLILGTFFGPVILGRAMLVPLDIAPNFFPKFHYLDPAASGVPKNHHVIDLLLGDVPRNVLVHEAWQRGEMPWWDPYTDGGKPLAAEANLVTASDPFKVILFHMLPFDWAYNLFRIVSFLVSGLTAFLLLRHFGFGFGISMWGGLLYEFAGCNFVWFMSPTVQAAFAYYPLLWLLWDLAIKQGQWKWFGVSSLVTALIFLSGNIQSHTYVFLFAIAFLAGYGWKRRERWRLLLSGVSSALLAGLCLSAPFVLPQVELFLLSARKVQPTGDPMSFLSGVASASAIFPWALGTFRTLDLSKFFGQSALGFCIYVGSAALLVAAIGATRPAQRNSADSDIKRTALALVLIYLVACSTPLLLLLYTRLAALAVLGIVILFARGWSFLSQRETPPLKSWARVILIGAVSMVVIIHLAALVVYPRYQAKIEARVIEAQKTNPSLDLADALRRFQVRNFPNEVTFRNPETLLAFFGMVALGFHLLKPSAIRAPALHGILILSTVPLLAFGHRFIPMQSRALWKQIQAGGPEQRRVASELRPGALRLFESAPSIYENVFPGALSQLFKVSVLHGYTSLLLSNTFFTGPSGRASELYYDYEYRSPTRGLERGELVRATHPGPSRFQWSDGSVRRRITVKDETSTRLTLALEVGEAADLIRADRFYPGWRAFAEKAELKVLLDPPCFSRVHVPANATEVRFVFQPRPWRAGLGIAAVTAVSLGCLLGASFRRKKIT